MEVLNDLKNQEQKRKELSVGLNDSEERFFVWFNMKRKFGKELGEKELNLIDSIYKNQQNDALVRVGLYRLINFLFGIIFMAVSLFAMKWQYQGPLCLVLGFAFTLINLVWGIKAKIDHRSFVKRQKSFANVKE